MRNPLPFSAAVLAVLAGSGSAVADDAAIAWGGNPRALHGHATVRMVAEKVKLQVGRHWTTVTCAFTFRNDGADCKVRMGFPDEATGSYQTDADPDEPVPSLVNFQSYVDGRKTKCAVIAGKSQNSLLLWHQKIVRFKHHESHFVVDQYRVRTGSGISVDGASVSEASYVLHTGSSWKGRIGKAVVLVQFAKDVLPVSIQLFPFSRLDVDTAYLYDGWAKVKPSHVYYSGFVKPVVRGHDVLFQATDLKPSDASDIHLYFKSEEHSKKKAVPKDDSDEDPG
jgi:hypothetical protein